MGYLNPWADECADPELAGPDWLDALAESLQSGLLLRLQPHLPWNAFLRLSLDGLESSGVGVEVVLRMSVHPMDGGAPVAVAACVMHGWLVAGLTEVTTLEHGFEIVPLLVEGPCWFRWPPGTAGERRAALAWLGEHLLLRVARHLEGER